MNKPNTVHGKLIVIEGIDGSGKTTLARGLETQLKKTNTPVLLTQEPGKTAIGTHLRTLLLDKKEVIVPKAEYLLFAANRAQHIKEVIIPKLQEGVVVISDRMADSSLAYQGFGRGLDLDMLRSINSWCMDNITPDLTIYLRLTPDIAMQRIHGRNIELTSFEQETRDYHQRVFDGYETIFANRNNVLTLDATQDPDTLINTAFEYITQRIL